MSLNFSNIVFVHIGHRSGMHPGKATPPDAGVQEDLVAMKLAWKWDAAFFSVDCNICKHCCWRKVTLISYHFECFERELEC